MSARGRSVRVSPSESSRGVSARGRSVRVSPSESSRGVSARGRSVRVSPSESARGVSARGRSVRVSPSESPPVACPLADAPSESARQKVLPWRVRSRTLCQSQPAAGVRERTRHAGKPASGRIPSPKPWMIHLQACTRKLPTYSQKTLGLSTELCPNKKSASP